MIARLVLAASAVVAATGCATTIRPPASPADPVAVALIDYGYHASLVLPAGERTSVEFAYGEWEWFALNHDAWYRVFPALCWPTAGALGRRRLEVPADPTALRAAIACEAALGFRVGRAEAEALRRRLEERFASRAETPIHNPLVGLTFVPDETSYCATVNCNTVLAGWLRELGCGVSWPACTSNFRLAGEEAPR